jgi:anti-sigma factor ChrR (cupin superfamily)
MRIRADFSQCEVVLPGDSPWVPSPMAGVKRRMLDRIGDEVARATSLVRYAPNSRFSAHAHGGGEEFLVLEGVFSDERGDYPAGTYVRNPIGSKHTPHSREGCTLFVKLHQFAPEDTAHVVIDTHTGHWLPGPVEGVNEQFLHAHDTERVVLERWASGTRLVPRAQVGGEEIYVLDGAFEDAQGRYPAGSWLRSPAGWPHALHSREGCTLYVKTGHLTGTIEVSPTAS